MLYRDEKNVKIERFVEDQQRAEAGRKLIETKVCQTYEGRT